MAAAIYCYGDMGVMRAGHGDVAKRAGVSTATVFNYYPTREALTEAVFSEVYSVFSKMFDNFPNVSRPATEQVKIMAQAYDFLVEKHPDLLKVVLNWSTSFGPGVRPPYLKFQDWVLNGIQTRMQSNKDDRTEARIILATAYSYARMKLDNTSEDIMSRFVDRIVEAIG